MRFPSNDESRKYDLFLFNLHVHCENTFFINNADYYSQEQNHFFFRTSQCLVNPCLLHYCRVCNIQLNSCRQAKIHSEGKKHEKRLSYLKFCLESSKTTIHYYYSLTYHCQSICMYIIERQTTVTTTHWNSGSAESQYAAKKIIGFSGGTPPH